MITAPGRPRHGIFVLLRRLRIPLTVLVVVYAIAVWGFTVVPGTDPQGQPWRMSFLHAFYFVSFLGTTIGLGEIPYPFSDAQRLWATTSIYGTVVAWLYAIGALFSVLQDPMFRRIVHENSMQRAVRRLREPFHLVCGYDDAGSRVAKELTQEGARLVVVEIDEARANAVDIEDLSVTVPALVGDASDPKTLLMAGLQHPMCAAVVALTGDDRVNTKIALTARLLNPALPVVCAVRNHEAHALMAAAGADHLINPYDTFAERVALAIRTPSLHVIYEALTTQAGTAVAEVPKVPKGRWVLCGFGSFSRTLRRQLERLGVQTVIVDTELDDSCDAGNSVRGDPTDPAVLRRADLDSATALAAGTDVDIDNLAITLAARSLNKKLFIVARQTQRRNGAVFRAAPADLVMLNGYVVAAEVLRVIRAPQLARFLRMARDEDEIWAAALLYRLREVTGSEVVESWSFEFTPGMTSAVCRAMDLGESVTIQRLLLRTDLGDRFVKAVPLLLQRDQARTLLPSQDTALLPGDRLLFCGSERARSIMRHAMTGHALPAMPAAPQRDAEQALTNP
jgi:Trk K+ transport system NAD-binding subunit